MAALKAVKDQASAPPDPAKFMPVAAVQALLEQRKAERGQDTERRIAAKVEAAVRDHYITLGMKSWAPDLCRSDEAAFDTFCEGAGHLRLSLQARCQRHASAIRRTL